MRETTLFTIVTRTWEAMAVLGMIIFVVLLVSALWMMSSNE